MKHKKKLITVAAIVIVAVIGMKIYSHKQKEAIAAKTAAAKVVYKNVKVGSIKSELVGDEFTGSGNIKLQNVVVYTAKLGGTLSRMNVQNGDRVAIGDTLFVIDNSDVKSAYLNAQSQVSSTKDSLSNAKFVYDRYTKLFKQELVSENDYLQKKNTYVTAKDSYNAAVASFANAKKNYRDLTVKSTINGVVSGVDLITANNELDSGQALCSVSSSNKKTVTVGLTASDVLKLKRDVNTKITVKIPSVDTQVSGKVQDISPVANSETKLYAVKILLSGNTVEIQEGMYALVDIILGTHKGLMVPADSVIISAFGSYLYKVDDSKAVKVPVETGVTIGKLIEVKASDLALGDKIMTEGQYVVSNGEKVTVLTADANSENSENSKKSEKNKVTASNTVSKHAEKTKSSSGSDVAKKSLSPGAKGVN